MRRQVLTALCCVASLGALSGCFSYDAAKPEVLYQNNLDETVTVYLEGAEFRYEVELGAGQNGGAPADECHGTAIVVETEDGDPVGQVDQAACPGWMLTINEDGTLTYAEL